MVATPSPTPKRGRPSRREPIFESALRLFRKRGFHATSIKDIGADAGVTGPALYSHFASKGDLLAEAIREGSRRIRTALDEALAGEDLAPDEALEQLVRTYVGVALDDADLNACYVLELRHLEPEYRRVLRRPAREFRNLWQERLIAVCPDIDPDCAKTLVEMAIFSVASLSMMQHRIDRKTLVELATRQVMQGLLGAGPETRSEHPAAEDGAR